MPLSPEARRALEALNRGPLRHPQRAPDPPAAPEPTVSARTPFPTLPAPPEPPVGAAIPAGPQMLEQLLSGRASECRSHRCFLYERPVHTPSWRNVPIAHQLREVFANPPGDAEGPLATLLGGPPERALLLDIETTGLTGGPLFLVGVLALEGKALMLRQFFARDYTEETGVLEHTRDLIREHPALVSFNGRTFDLPYLANRAAYHRLPSPSAPLHVDLLHLARRRWRGRLPDCRLQTLERFICRRHRVDDIPGDMMARVYHDYVRTGDATRIRQVFQHNLMDLVTMAEILCVLAAPPPGARGR
ncbi:MAG: ribonuclease H-like domain-containing protein [Armatimonadetes bacterium]|nr:ribonuclease H-like domain-containing protein [Armatimonadota bacterium]